MTAPTPNSPGGDRPQQYDPWAHRPPAGPQPPAPSPGGGGPAYGPPYGYPYPGGPGHGGGGGLKNGGGLEGGGGDGLRTGEELRDGAVVAVAVSVLGVALGLLWLWLAPRVPLVADGAAVYLKHPEGEEAIGADGTFVLLGLGLGAVAGLAVAVIRRQGGVGLAVGLAIGGLLASLLGWWLGISLGPAGDLAARAKEAGQGNVFDGPLELQAKGALLALPFAAVGAHLLGTALFATRDPDPPPPQGPYGW